MPQRSQRTGLSTFFIGMNASLNDTLSLASTPKNPLNRIPRTFRLRQKYHRRPTSAKGKRLPPRKCLSRSQFANTARPRILTNLRYTRQVRVPSRSTTMQRCRELNRKHVGPRTRSSCLSFYLLHHHYNVVTRSTQTADHAQ